MALLQTESNDFDHNGIRTGNWLPAVVSSLYFLLPAFILAFNGAANRRTEGTLRRKKHRGW